MMQEDIGSQKDLSK